MPSFVFKLREIERIVEWFTVKSPESHLGHSHVARNLSHVARNFSDIARNFSDVTRKKSQVARF